MKDIILDFNHPITLRLQTRPNGDIEVVQTERKKEGGAKYGNYGNVIHNGAGGDHDTIVGVIPKTSRASVAGFLVTA